MSKKPLASWRLVSVVALATTTAMWTALPTMANAADAAAGKKLFQDKTCSACHTVGGGDLVGPDLKNVTKERPHEWLAAMDRSARYNDRQEGPDCDRVAAQVQRHGDAQPGAQRVRGRRLLAYLGNSAAGGAALAGRGCSAAAAALKGNAETGKDLFTGAERFANGGPPCMACHSTGGIGALGGGRLGLI